MALFIEQGIIYFELLMELVHTYQSLLTSLISLFSHWHPLPPSPSLLP